MAIVKGFRHTGIICKDIAKSLEFYKDFLGPNCDPGLLG